MQARFLAATGAAFLAMTVMAVSTSAREEIPAETRLFPFSADLATCESAGVLDTIQSRFNGTERRYWGGTVEITGFEKTRQAAFRPHGLDLVPRRYCQTVALLSNNRKAVVRYAIIDGYGLAAHGSGIQFCVQGYDRNHTAMPSCARLDR